ncbi:MAG: GntR family transcriptional regulator [Clostridium sp.]
MELELNSKEPIYVQIKMFVKLRIVSGELKGGERLLSVRDYASELKVNPNTILRVYSELENDGLIITQRGIGKFVTEDIENIKKIRKEASTNILKEFISKSKVLGFSKDEILELINEMYEEV